MLTSRDTVLALAVAGSSLLASCDAFSLPNGAVASLRSPLSRSAVISSSARPLRAAGLRMGYLDDVDGKSGTRNEAGLDKKGDQIMPTTNYEEFVDCEDGFDGGDGQVGVVGDGSNAMDNFFTPDVGGIEQQIESLSAINEGRKSGDIADAVGGVGKVSGGTKDGRVDKRWNAWGADMADITEELREAGVEQIDALTGEDLKKVQRQQLNNWFAQRAVWSKESAQRDEMEKLAGADHRQMGTTDYFAELAKGKSSEELTEAEKENIIFATGARGVENKEALIKNDWKACAAGSRIDGEFAVQGEGMVTIEVEPNSMVGEQFIARFTGDTDTSAWLVAKTGYDLGSDFVQGTLPRRGTTVEFFVRFQPSDKVGPPKLATLVIDAEDGWKWTYKITGSV